MCLGHHSHASLSALKNKQTKNKSKTKQNKKPQNKPPQNPPKPNQPNKIPKQQTTTTTTKYPQRLIWEWGLSMWPINFFWWNLSISSVLHEPILARKGFVLLGQQKLSWSHCKHTQYNFRAASEDCRSGTHSHRARWCQSSYGREVHHPERSWGFGFRCAFSFLHFLPGF